jgi:hypothetical protein
VSGARVGDDRRLQRRIVDQVNTFTAFSAAWRRVLRSASDLSTAASAAFCISTSMVV